MELIWSHKNNLAQLKFVWVYIFLSVSTDQRDERLLCIILVLMFEPCHYVRYMYIIGYNSAFLILKQRTSED